MQRLESLEHLNIFEFRGYRLNMKERWYRLYQQFCDYTDFASILGHYKNVYEPRIYIYRHYRTSLQEAEMERLRERIEDGAGKAEEFLEFESRLANPTFESNTNSL
jgi:hypothetical protein